MHHKRVPTQESKEPVKERKIGPLEHLTGPLINKVVDYLNLPDQIQLCATGIKNTTYKSYAERNKEYSEQHREKFGEFNKTLTAECVQIYSPYLWLLTKSLSPALTTTLLPRGTILSMEDIELIRATGQELLNDHNQILSMSYKYSDALSSTCEKPLGYSCISGGFGTWIGAIIACCAGGPIGLGVGYGGLATCGLVFSFSLPHYYIETRDDIRSEAQANTIAITKITAEADKAITSYRSHLTLWKKANNNRDFRRENEVEIKIGFPSRS